MLKTIVIISISIFFSGCCNHSLPNPVPDKLKYISYAVGNYIDYVVNDSLSDGYKVIKTDSSKIDLLNSYYKSYFDKERIETIDFQDSLKVELAISSSGKILKILHSKYSLFNGEIDFIGSLSNSYVSLDVNSYHNAYISYVMSSYKKQNQPFLKENVVATSYYYMNPVSNSVKDLIIKENLKSNDTIYSSFFQLIYHTY